MKAIIINLFVVMVLGSISCSKTNQSSVEDKEELVLGNKENMIVGATLYQPELNTIKEELYLKDFKYLTPANAAKQHVVHPEPNKWNWGNIDDFIDFSKENNLEVRIHGPISPQCSKWAKEDIRTAQELEDNMTDFLIASCKKYNNVPTIKWMDVVNETIKEWSGEWLENREGVDQWENPWYKMGVDENGYPLFILKAFEIATKHAPNIKLVYNCQGGMQDAMWDKVKETVLYLRSKGHRVDGIGWQGHILLNKNSAGFVENPDEEAQKFADLIDWAHENNLEFHVTELDFYIEDLGNLEAGYKKQADAYQKIVDVLIEKSKNGVVTLNLWDLGVRINNKIDRVFHSIYDEDFKPTPAYKVIKEALNHQF